MLAMLKPLVILDWSTNCYQSADLGQTLPQDTFTNHYHRGEGQGIDLGVEGSVGQRGQSYVGLEWWHTIKSGRHHRRGVEKIF